MEKTTKQLVSILKKEVPSAHNFQQPATVFLENALASADCASTGLSVVKPINQPQLPLFLGQNLPKLWIQQINKLAILDRLTLYNIIP
jgi:hypothetical protein